MPRYLITCDISSASGTQTWWVDAPTPEKALERFGEGRGTFYAEEVCVEDLGPPSISGELDQESDKRGKTMTTLLAKNLGATL